ncbi:MAG: DUF167 family protein [Rhodospirillaceae bacterium]|jgi:uncharacterized protein (TIGR00251 family)|nr:DUF167 family protein [Rhodospirillaceae bacterium]
MASFLNPVVTDGVHLTVKLTPKASCNCIESFTESVNDNLLKISVTTVPEDGKANKAMINLLSKSWKIAKRSIRIVSGVTSRRKILFIEGDVENIKLILKNYVKKHESS